MSEIRKTQKTWSILPILLFLASALGTSGCNSDGEFTTVQTGTDLTSGELKNNDDNNNMEDDNDGDDENYEVAWNGDNVLEFSQLIVRIEANDTDGDAGLQLFFDAEGWNKVTVRDPNNRQLVEVKARGALRELGLTEGFFESEEPSFDELPLDEFLAMFPEGIYRFYGKTSEGEKLYGEAELTHDIPEAPVAISPLPIGGAECAEDVAIPAQIMWMDPNMDVVVTGFEVIVEREEPVLQVFSIQLPASAMMVTVPSEFLEPDTEYKFEIIAEEESDNRTITEGCFVTAD